PQGPGIWLGTPGGCNVRFPRAAGLEEHRGLRCLLGFLEQGQALCFGGIWPMSITLRLLLRPEDWPAQITWQRRPQLRYFGRRWRLQLRVVCRQLLQPLGACHAVDVV